MKQVTFKRKLSLTFLALVLALGMMPVPAMAAETAQDGAYVMSLDGQGQPLSSEELPAVQTSEDELAPLAAKDGTQPDSGTCGAEGDGENITWYYDGAGTLTLTGTGSSAFYNENDRWGSFYTPVPDWYAYRESITKIVVGEGIEMLDSALFAHTSITSITLPSTIKTIGQLLFVGCKRLTTVNLNEGLETIGSTAFKDTALTSLYLPSTVKEIDATNFRTIDIPNITISPNNKYLKVVDGLLYTADMTKLIRCSMSYSGALTLPNTLVEIADSACEGVRGITSVTLPNGLKRIGAGAFNLSGLRSVVIPDSVEEVGRSAFSNCYSMTYAKVGSGYKGSTDPFCNSMFAFNEKLATVELSEGLEVIESRMFGGCTALTNVIIPQSVKIIEGDAFAETGLTSVNIPDGVRAIGYGAFANTNLTAVTLPSHLEELGDYAFSGTGITQVVLPDSLTSLGNYVFPQGTEIVGDVVIGEDGSIVLASAYTTLEYDVTVVEEDARAMLTLVNNFRTGSDAWYWNTTSTEKIYCQGLSVLQYDKNLEAIAQARAAELAVNFAHTRPNGTDCFTLEVNGVSSYAENIAAGYSTAQAAFTGWEEANARYYGQGHRRNMLGSSYNAIGIGHVVCQGVHYWTQEFGNLYTVSAPTASATTMDRVCSVSVPASMISRFPEDLDFGAGFNLDKAGDSALLPKVETDQVVLRDAWYWTTVRVAPAWKSTDASQARVDGGQVKALVDNNSAYLKGYANGKAFYVPLGSASARWTVQPNYAAGKALVCRTNGVSQGSVPLFDGQPMWKTFAGNYVALIDADGAASVSPGKFGVTSGMPQSAPRGDVNGNGPVNIVDAQLAYDLACDRFADFSVLPAAGWVSADANGDRCVDAGDAQAIQSFALKGAW